MTISAALRQGPQFKIAAVARCGRTDRLGI